MTPGRLFSTRTSELASSALKTSLPCSDFRSISMLFLLRLTLLKYMLTPATFGWTVRVKSPTGGFSILM